MRRKFAVRSIPILAILAAAACGGDSPTHPKSYNATGTWSGTGSGITLRLTLSQSGQNVTGNGTMSGASSVAVSATGTNVSPNLSLTLHAAGYEDTNVAGTFTTATSINATLNGSGFTGETMTLLKQ